MGNGPGKNVERRRRLYVDRALQGRLIGMMVLFIVLAAVLYLILHFLMGNGSIWITLSRLLVALLLALTGAIYTGLRLSNRIAGPIYHFARTLSKLNRGEYDQELKFRKHDQFQNVAAAFNQTIESIRSRVREDIAFLDTLAGQLEGMSGLEPQTKESILKQIQEYKARKEQHLVKRSENITNRSAQ